MNIKIVKESCTGCRACELLCPKNCIQMYEDDEGFIYPVVSKECNACGKCLKGCHVLIRAREMQNNIAGYFGWHTDESVRSNSSSGGAFSAIVESISEDGGSIVFGACHDLEKRKVRHIKCNHNDYYLLRKSKYVFSDVEFCFKEVKGELLKDKKVVFSGTPCQVSGLHSYLSEDYAHLYTIDFICHGVPSMKFLNDHLSYISEGKEIRFVDFRSKAYGWWSYCLKVRYKGYLNYLKKLSDDCYMYAFLNNHSLRKCCYDCQYSNRIHDADITIADFWGIKKYNPDYDDEKGISLLIVNTEKGKNIIKKIKSKMLLWELENKDYQYVFKKHTHYSKPKRSTFFRLYKKGSYEEFIKMYKKDIKKTSIKKKIAHAVSILPKIDKLKQIRRSLQRGLFKNFY